MLKIGLLILFSIMSTLILTPDALAKVTPSDVFSHVKSLESVIGHLSVAKRQRIETIKLLDAKPLHVYAIATALNEKIILMAKIQDEKRLERPKFPNKTITPTEVLSLVLAIEHNLKVLQPNSKFSLELVKHKRPKDVLRLLVRCHLLIDSVIEKMLLPKHPFQVVEQMNNLLVEANASTNQSVLLTAYPMYSAVKPTDVFVNAESLFKSLMSAGHLKYNIDYPKRPYYSPYDEKRIKPVHVFTVTVMNWVLLQDYLRRSGKHFNSTLEFRAVSNIVPANVYQQYEKTLLLWRIYLSTAH